MHASASVVPWPFSIPKYMTLQAALKTAGTRIFYRLICLLLMIVFSLFGRHNFLFKMNQIYQENVTMISYWSWLQFEMLIIL